MKVLKTLKLEDLLKQQCNTLVYDCLKNTAPEEIGQLIQAKSQSNSYSFREKTQNPQDVEEPKFNTKQGRGGFRAQAPLLWNKISNDVREAKNRIIFKNQLKREILAGYIESTECNNPLCRDQKHHIPT
tara:strand:+ start:404 stop:790 length:387 start_codon:yes stop_codon:yes gene_type:complete